MRLMAWMLLLSSSFALSAERPDDFAYGMPVQVDALDALYEVELPVAVYRGVTRSDLGDMRIFNAQGEVVPHALRPRSGAIAAKPDPVELPFFPLYADAGDDTESMNVRVQRRSNGTIVSVQSGSKAGPAQRRLRGYVLDASRLNQPLLALAFEWKQAAAGYSGRISVEGSDDLARWSVLMRDASLVSLEFGGHKLEQKRLELSGQKQKYLRITWGSGQQALELTAVSAEVVAGSIEPQRVWLGVRVLAPGAKPGEYEFDLGGHFTFDRMRIDLPQENTVAQLRLLARSRPSDDWRPASSAIVYRLRRDGKEIKSPDIAVTGRGERYWLLRIEQKGGGVGVRAPDLNIGWVPQRLVFAARGSGPFQIAYGNRTVQSAAYPIATLIPGYGTDGELRAKLAVPGEQTVLGGAGQLRERVDHRKLLLWASLFLGVALLAWMAYRLSRQMTKTPSGSGSAAQNSRAPED
jgi:hypothetical protein